MEVNITESEPGQGISDTTDEIKKSINSLSITVDENCNTIKSIIEYNAISRNSLKRFKVALNKISKMLFVTIIISIILGITLIVFTIINTIKINKIKDLEKKIDLLEANKKSLELTIDTDRSEMKSLIGVFSEILVDVSETAVTLDNENDKLLKLCKEKDDNLNLLKDREELFNKYEYVLFKENNVRTDVSYENIKTVQSILKEKGLHEDVADLIFSIVMTESRGTATAANTDSTARGLGQFLEGTGKYVYQDMMKAGMYDHYTMAFDPETNLTMMVYYIEHLNKKNNSDIDKIIKSYRGLESPEYKASLNKYLGTVGKDLHSLQLNE